MQGEGNNLEAWIGRRIFRLDTVTPWLIAPFSATLKGSLAEDAVPLGLFQALSPDAIAPTGLGRDGHSRQGLNLPRLPLPLRMWAGGER